MLSPAAPSVLRRNRALIWTCVILVMALAWVYLIHLDRQMSASAEYDMRMAAMGMSTPSGMTMDKPWTAADAWLTFAMWTVMMVGMMAGAAIPMLLLFAGAQARRSPRGASLRVLTFGLGYFTAWAGFSAIATLVQGALHRAAMLSPAMKTSSPRLAGAILLAAGAYQLTPWKARCLTHCRSPLGFLMTNWREGKLGAVRMGTAHGAYCVGCCWALMCVLFAVGVMNLAWVAVLTVFVLLEKTGPGGAMVARAGGVAIAIGGILLLTASR